MAPELIAAGRCTEKADIFSFGVVLYEIMTAQQPLRGRSEPVRCCAFVEERKIYIIHHSVSLLSQPSSRDQVDNVSLGSRVVICVNTAAINRAHVLITSCQCLGHYVVLSCTIECGVGVWGVTNRV